MKTINILLLGSGGREHTFAWKLAQSPLLGKLFIAPGNAGTMHHGININISPVDFESVAKIVKSQDIGLVLVGPEDPLVEGISDYFSSDPALRNIPVIGPCRSAARLEGSKDFAKDFMTRHGIPTAAYRTFDKTKMNEAAGFIHSLQPPYVLKADGLAAGKGVVILPSVEEAIKTAEEMLLGSKFGKAGEKLVIEQFLQGIECSVFILTDGKSYCLLPEAKDYKKIGEGDTGPNTGGMGTISGVPFADETFMEKVTRKIIEPTITGLRTDGIDYRGFIFFGLMNVKGEPYVIEYNARMGDPETESVLPRIENDFVELLMAAARQELNTIKISVKKEFAATVMLVSGGYPGSYQKGKAISGLEKVQDSLVFHAGTAIDEEGNVITSGGRVLGITSFGKTLTEAFEKSYTSASLIEFDGMYFRRDLGKDLL